MFRRSGVFLPVASLPSRYGIGSLGEEAKKFIDFLSDSGFSYWFILPLSPVEIGDAPLSACLASKALDYGLIDLDALMKEELLQDSDLNFLMGRKESTINFRRMRLNKLLALKIAYRRFQQKGGEYGKDFTKFHRSGEFLDFASYRVLKEINRDQPWNLFKDDLSKYTADQYREVIHNHKDEVNFYLWTQYVFLQQWKDIHDYAALKGVAIVSPMPFFVCYDSVEVYKHRRNFQLDDDGRMSVSVGYPPNAFYPKGKSYDRPYYSFTYLKKMKYHLFQDRFNFYSEMYDMVILDNFPGYFRNYLVPPSSTDGLVGGWFINSGETMLDFMIKDMNKVIAGGIAVTNRESEAYLQSHDLMDTRILEEGYFNEMNLAHRPRNYSFRQVSFSSYYKGLSLKEFLSSLRSIDLKMIYERVKSDCLYYGINVPRRENLDGQVKAMMEINMATSSAIAVDTIGDLLSSRKEKIRYDSLLEEEDLDSLDRKMLKLINRRYGRC